MKKFLARALTASTLFASLLGVGGDLWAQSFPSKQVRIVVPQTPGGPSDLLARLMAMKLSEKWGQPVIVENRPGGSTIIAAQEVVRSKPDGYTLFQPINSTLTINPLMVAKPPYDIHADFTHITHLADVPIAFYTGSPTGITSIAELIARAKAKPGTLVSGTGDPSTRLSAEMFARMAGVKFTQIQYKGGSEVSRALLTGDVQLGVVGAISGAPYVKAGQFRVLASGGKRRMGVHPDVPTMQEAGIANYDASVWVGLSAPAGVPRDIVNKINADVAAILQQPDVREKIAAMGMEPVGSSPEAYVEKIRTETARFRPLISELGMKLE